MTLAAVQLSLTLGDLEGNLQKHLRYINQASTLGVGLIVFPEMSLTGYGREEGSTLALALGNPILSPLQEKAQAAQMIIIVGAPLRLAEQLFIGSFIFLPNGEIQMYTKQYLHDGEELYYASSFSYNPLIALGKERMKLAICADIDHAEHPAQAKAQGASIYLSSIFFSKNGIEGGCQQLKSYARQYALPVLMSNYCGAHWGIAL
ncbi:MAG: carbon-nitrogen hydrolase family protein [Bacteroidota bacterium]